MTFSRPTVDWPGIRDRVFGRVDPISASGRGYREGQDHMTLYAAHARFTGERRLALSTGEELTADRVVVASGPGPRGSTSRACGSPTPTAGCTPPTR